MNLNKRLINLIACYLIYKKYKKWKKKKQYVRRFWVNEIYLSRDEMGFFSKVYPIIKRDGEKFFKCTRMTLNLFNTLLKLLEHRLEKNSIRRTIPPECRLLLTIMYLAHGGPRYTYCSKFQIGETTFRTIIYETCSAIWEELSGVYLSFPNEDELSDIASHYYTKSKMPNCIGVIGGKHINVVCPRSSGSKFNNFKGKFSIILLATCDTDCTFTMIDIGAYVSQSDEGVFQNSNFGKLLLENKLKIPKDKILPDSEIVFPHYFVGDSGFPLKRWLMLPYPGNNLTESQNYFNYRLSSARITIENTFGIMTSRWRILLNNIHVSLEHVHKIVQAIVVLHNYVMLNNKKQYCPADYKDNLTNGELREGQWRTNTIPLKSFGAQGGHIYSNLAYDTRNTLCEYLFKNKSDIF